jgi:hypothetical protein
MRKAFLACAFVAVCLAPLRADITLVQTMTMEGAAAGMMQPGQLPKITQRVKGMKARTDVEAMGQTMTSITDLAQKQVIILQPGTKVAQVFTPASVAASGKGLPTPKVDVSFKATGKTQTIEGLPCDEHTFSMKFAMSELAGGPQMPPEAAAMMKDVTMVMTGSMWVARSAPGAAELMAFNKAAMQSNLLGAISGLPAGQTGGMDKMMAAIASAPGVPYLTEITMTVEGTGQMAQAMSQMGPMKMIQKASSVSTAAISDDIFSLPEGYTIDKK